MLQVKNRMNKSALVAALAVAFAGFKNLFFGDSTHWTPTWAGGGLDKFKGRSLTFEIRFWNGEIYSISGNMTPMMYVQARQWDLFKTDPYRAGW